MGSIIRLVGGVPIAALVTLALFLLMRQLIWVEEVTFDDRPEEFNLTIDEVVEEIEIARRETTIDQIDQIDPPPPPPQIERQAAEQPTEGLSTVIGAIPEFDQPSLNSNNISFSVSDRDAQPLVRIEPQYPPRAAERGVEGTCDVTFDVAPDGSPFNIRILQCDSSLFERASIRAVERWRYNPKIQDGVAVARTGVQTQFIFQLAD
jgi:protein TonB